jgi:type IV pilus assembly protein PilM
MISWTLKARGLRPIGLDIGHNSIKMLQLTINGDHVSILAADKVRVDPSVNGDEQKKRAFAVSAIKQMLAGGNFRGRNVVSCVPNDKLRITSLRLAEVETGQIEQALEKEAAHRFGLDLSNDAIDYLLAGSVRQGDETKTELILFATDKETIKTHIAMLEEAQLKPVGIDTVPCALFRSFERSLRRQADRELTVVFVDVGSRFTTVVFGHGGGIRFIKQVAIGGERFNRDIAARLGVDINEAEMLRGRLRMERDFSAPEPDALDQTSADGERRLDASTRQVMIDAISVVADELAREISRCLRYYTVTFRGGPIGRFSRVERLMKIFCSMF